MKKFIEKHTANIHGVLSCVDRIIFKGYSFLSWSQNMENFLTSNGMLVKEFKFYAMKLSKQLREHGVNSALGRPYFRPIFYSLRKKVVIFEAKIRASNFVGTTGADFTIFKSGRSDSRWNCHANGLKNFTCTALQLTSEYYLFS